MLVNQGRALVVGALLVAVVVSSDQSYLGHVPAETTATWITGTMANTTTTTPTSKTTPPQSPCGRTTLSEPEGHIQLFKMSANCTWTVSFPNQSYSFVYFMFHEFKVPETNFLTIRDGTPNKTIIGNFTGNIPMAVVYSVTNLTTLTLTVSPQTTVGSFNIQYSMTECMFDVDNIALQFASPVYLQSNGNLECTYKYRYPPPLASRALTFTRFDLVKGELEINDTKGIVKYNDSGEIQPPDYFSKSSQFDIHLRLSTTKIQQIAADISLLDECSGKYQLGTYEVVTLSAPRDDSVGRNCWFLVQSPEGSTVSIEVVNISLTSDLDYILINDGGSWLSPPLEVITRHSSVQGVNYLTSGNHFWMQFSTGPGNGKRDFNIRVVPQVFGGRMQNAGQFQLGLTNHSVVTNQTLVMYQFQAADENSQVVLNLGRNSTVAPTSLIECYEGFSPQSKIIATFRTTTEFRPVFSNGPRMLLILTGFLGPNGTVINNQHLEGDFKSVPNDGTLYNSHDDTGSYKLEVLASKNKTSATWLVHNHHGNGNMATRILPQSLTNGTIRIYDHTSTQTSQPLVTLNSTFSTLPMIMLPKVRVDYTSAARDTSAVIYEAFYQYVPVCNSTLSATASTLLSPGFPDSYPLNAICTWNISQGPLVHLAFDMFDLSAGHLLDVLLRTRHTYNVTVGNHSHIVTNYTETIVGSYSGVGLPGDVVSRRGDDSELRVRFSSEHLGDLTTGRGWNMSYEVVDCGGNVTAKNASLMTPGYPKPVTKATTCVWIISLPVNHTANASVNIVSYTFSVDNASALEIRDGPSHLSALIPLHADTKSKSKKPKSVLSRGSSLWVRYTYSPGKQDPTGKQTTGPGFSLNYTTHVCDRKHQCDNGVCLQDAWKCNGVDDCGDGTDERDCVFGGTSGYAGWVLAVAVILTAIVVLALVILVPKFYKRARTPNYSTLRDMDVEA